MIPRKRIDIGCADLLRALGYCVLPGNADAAAASVQARWDTRPHLACLAVRSGLDALLSVLALPTGTAVLMSAVNIADMARIVEAHGLRVVPVDIDMSTLAVTRESLARAYAQAPDARVCLIAHLYGSRMPLSEIGDFCFKNNMLLVEDCAQGYTGDGWRGAPESDVTLFSFGPVKTATALGGAMMGFRDAALSDRVREHMQQWPLQLRTAYALRLLKYLAFAPFAYRWPYGGLARVCRWLGISHDRFLSAAVRGFSNEQFLARIRKRASLPLLRLLALRLARKTEVATEWRAAIGEQLLGLLGRARCMGSDSAYRAHWLFPIMHDKPDGLAAFLQQRGFDATRKASSIGVITAPSGVTPPAQALAGFQRLLYLPAHEGMRRDDATRLASAVCEFDQWTASP